jgi:hypothetical protein
LWWGNRVVRLGLIWLLLHLTFIYWALWTQLPLLYAGRHIYQAMIGLVLAVGATLEMVLAHYLSAKRPRRARRKKQEVQRALRPGQWVQIVALVAVTAVSFHHFNQIRQTQQRWLADVTEEAETRKQLAELFPTISPDNHFFAVRFPIAPMFTRTVVQLWYDTPLERPGGGLDQLRTASPVTRDFVVLDYDDGQLVNLMPELQQHDETIFLWAQRVQQVWLDASGRETILPDPEATLPILASPSGSQLVLKLTPTNGRWLSHKISLELPESSVLETAVLPQPGLHYRVRLQTNSGGAQILYETTGDESPDWQRISVPLHASSGSTVTLRLEVFGENLGENSAAYWANPRVGIDYDQ